MPASDARALHDLLLASAEEASALALSYFRRGVAINNKADGSPVTEADLAVDAFLRKRLMTARPILAGSRKRPLTPVNGLASVRFSLSIP